MTAHRVFLPCLFFLIFSYSLAAIDLYIAPEHRIDNRSEENLDDYQLSSDLHNAFQADYEPRGFAVRLISGVDAPVSFLEAARLSEMQGVQYLLYGFIRVEDRFASVEYKLYDAESKSVVKLFFSSDSIDAYDRLVETLRSNIRDYFVDELGFGPPEAENAEVNIVMLPVSLGYWTPMDAEWSPYMAGLVHASISGLFIPSDPAFHIFRRRATWGFGVGLGYAIAVSRADFEPATYNRISLRLPVEGFLDIGGVRSERIFTPGTHVFNLGISADLHLDILAQSRKYGELVSSVSSALGMSVKAGYIYGVSRKISLGLNANFGYVGYVPAQLTFSTAITMNIFLGKDREAEL
jgi:hypothetical protein